MEDMKELLNFSLINIDKSAGPTSYSVSEFVRRQLGQRSKTPRWSVVGGRLTWVTFAVLMEECYERDKRPS